VRKISARNQIVGRVVGVQKGQTTAHVKVDIGGGVVVTASITNEAVDASTSPRTTRWWPSSRPRT
jgi:molybdopterin-binding protein